MADEKTLAKVQRVHEGTQITKGPHGKVYRYNVWLGWYWEGGKRKGVYLGRELPDSLRGLVGKREFKRLNGNPDWPSSIRRERRLDPAAAQVVNG